MRETIGSTWTLQLIMGFTFLFVSFLAVTISFSKAFRIRNEVTSIVEKNGGFTNNARDTIAGYIKSSGYRTTGRCPYEAGKNLYGVDLEGDTTRICSGDTQNYLYCIKRDYTDSKLVTNVVYEVTTFYKFGLPIVGNLTIFRVKGKTTDMVKIDDLFSDFDWEGC